MIRSRPRALPRPENKKTHESRRFLARLLRIRIRKTDFQLAAATASRLSDLLKNWSPVLLWMGLIFLLSHQDKDQSRETSEFVLAILNFLNLDRATLEAYHLPFLIRKGAHFTEYGILSLLIWRGWRLEWGGIPPWWGPVLICFLYACTDEFHQSFVPGRGAAFSDVLIDTSGALVAMLLWAGWWKWRHKRTHNAAEVEK